MVLICSVFSDPEDDTWEILRDSVDFRRLQACELIERKLERRWFLYTPLLSSKILTRH